MEHGRISTLRTQIVDARRTGDVTIVADVKDKIRELADQRYRCCLVDFKSCAPAFYVRVLGFERFRVKAALEFPIEPRLRSVQWIPISHMADCDEVQDENNIREIYLNMAPFVRCKTTCLQWEKEPLVTYDTIYRGCNNSFWNVVTRWESNRVPKSKLGNHRNFKATRNASRVLVVGWWASGILFSVSLVLIVM